MIPSPPSDLAVVLVDDRVMVREGIAMQINALSHVSVVAQGRTGRAAIAMVHGQAPDVAVIGIAFAHGSALSETCVLRARWPMIRTILLGTAFSDATIDAALRSRVEGIVDTREPFHRLQSAIVNVARGRRSYPHALRRRLAAARTGKTAHLTADLRLPGLTPREHEIVPYLADGYTVGQIAERLGLAASTVDNHKTRLMRKLGIHSTVQLTRYAIREGLVTP